MTTAIEKVIHIAEESTEELRRSHADPRTGEVTPKAVRYEIEENQAAIREARQDLESVPIYQVGFRRPDGSTEICDITPAFKESKIRDELISRGWTPPGNEGCKA